MYCNLDILFVNLFWSPRESENVYFAITLCYYVHVITKHTQQTYKNMGCIHFNKQTPCVMRNESEMFLFVSKAF